MENMSIVWSGVDMWGNEFQVIKAGWNYAIRRNQGDHDRRFFLLTMIFDNAEDAVNKAQYLCTRDALVNSKRRA